MIDLEQMDELPKGEQMRNPRNRRTKKVGKCNLRKLNEHKPSEPEQLVATYLAMEGIEYVMEKTWPDLVSVLFNEPLPIDFWLPGYRACIEVDGSHHRIKIKGDKSYSLDRRKLNDQTRDLFCLRRGFKLLRIRSDRMENYKELIKEFLNLKDENKY